MSEIQTLRNELDDKTVEVEKNDRLVRTYMEDVKAKEIEIKENRQEQVQSN